MAPTSLKRKLLGVAFDSRTSKSANKNTPRKKTKTNKSASSSRKKRNAKHTKAVTAPVSPWMGSPVAAVAASGRENDTAAPLKPKVEYSPNAMAKCQACRRKIQKNHKRYGFPEYSDRYSKEIYRYYHLRCCPKDLKAQLPNAEAELSRQMQTARDNIRIVETERQDLYKKLKKLRLLFANRLEVPFFMVWNNNVLNELVVQMPTTPTELLNVHGIGPTKLKSFGDPILTVIRQYTQQQQLRDQASSLAGAKSNGSTSNRKLSIKSEATHNRSAKRGKKSARAKEVICIDVDDDDDDSVNEDKGDGEDVIIGASLSCEQLVSQKFAHAAKNGYVISID